MKKLFKDEQAVEGFYAWDEHVIYLDFLRSQGNLLTQRHNVHHELYHMLEVQMGDLRSKDHEWAALNDASFVYEERDIFRRTPSGGSFFGAPFPGFTSEYAMTSPEEDRAEVYACLLIPSQNKIVHRWMQKDGVLKKKVGFIKTLVRMFCDAMDEHFWQDLGNSKK